MKKSTMICICMTAVFVAAGWLLDSLGMLVAAVVVAMAALVMSLKGRKRK